MEKNVRTPKFGMESMLEELDRNDFESASQRMLKKTINTIEKNIGNPKFGVATISEELGISRSKLYRKIKAITGSPPGELIRIIRLRKAAFMLLNQLDSVSQIGYAVGFNDNSYFSKSFKRHFGIVPSEYSESHEKMN